MNEISQLQDKNQPNLMTIQELSGLLNVPVKTIRQWVYKSQIPNIKLNGAVRFDSRAINTWIAGSTREEKSDLLRGTRK